MPSAGNLTRESLLFSPTRDGIPSSDDNFTADDLIAAQDALEQEASDVIPWRFDLCTGDSGYIKQAVYACLTCLNYAGVCAGCSVKCHGEHELVELFARRDFKCDCGSERMGAGSFCSLANRDDAPPNLGNKYSKNFKGIFCICGVPYDPHTETDAMYQCLVCEDWLHHACLFGTHSDANASPLGTDDFDMLICAACVTTNARLRRILDRWAGVEGRGVMLVSKEDAVLGRATLEDDDEEEIMDTNGAEKDSDGAPLGKGVGAGKRKADSQDSKSEDGNLESEEEAEARARQAKKTKHGAVAGGSAGDSDVPVDSSSPAAQPASIASTSSSSAATASTAASSTAATECHAPPVLPKGTSVLDTLEKEGGRVNVFLEEGWMERWCRCSDCLVDLNQFPFMLEEEEIYEPPDDPDAHKSTLELGMEALSRIPRGQAIDGALAFTGLSERLRAFLRPHADAGETVTKQMVDEFFAAERERAHLR